MKRNVSVVKLCLYVSVVKLCLYVSVVKLCLYVSVVKLCLYVSECVCSKMIKELPGLVGSGTPCTFRCFSSFGFDTEVRKRRIF